MEAKNLAIMLPIIISLGVFLMIWGIRYMENKENMAMIERGMEPRRRRRETDPSRTLKNGLLFVGAGLGLLLAILLVNTVLVNASEETQSGVFFALIAIFGGLGMLGAYFYERKNPPAQ